MFEKRKLKKSFNNLGWGQGWERCAKKALRHISDSILLDMLIYGVSEIQTQKKNVEYYEHQLKELQEKYDKTAEGKKEIEEQTKQAIERRRREIIGEIADRGIYMSEKAICLMYEAEYGRDRLMEAQKHGIIK